MVRTAERGDIWHVALDPTLGKEQRGKRYVFVVSPAKLNKLGLVIVLPISQGETLARSTGFACTLMGAGLQTQGVVICNQPRTVDFQARGAQYMEQCPHYIIDDVLARLAPLVV